MFVKHWYSRFQKHFAILYRRELQRISITHTGAVKPGLTSKMVNPDSENFSILHTLPFIFGFAIQLCVGDRIRHGAECLRVHDYDLKQLYQMIFMCTVGLKVDQNFIRTFMKKHNPLYLEYKSQNQKQNSRSISRHNS